MKTELHSSRGVMVKVHIETSISTTQEPAMAAAMAVAPPGGGGRKIFSEILGNGSNAKRFAITVTSRDNQNSETIKEILKSNIDPTEIKLGINTLKTLRNGSLNGNKHQRRTGDVRKRH